MKKPLVTVIIPTYNAGKDIRRCLESIKNQTYKNVEIVVVDQTSTDDTAKIAKEYTKKLLFREKPPFYSPPAKSRNMGAKISKGEFLYNVDADMQLHPKLIEDCLEKMNSGEFVALIVHEVDIGLNFWSRCRALEKKVMIKDPYMEAARFVSKKAFDKVNGYDSDLGSGEDWDLNARLKAIGKVGYSKYPVFHHNGKKELIKNFKKMMDYGRTFDKYRKKHPELSKKQLTPFREMYFRNWDILARHPVYTLGLGILKFSEFLGAFIGLIISKNNYVYKA